MKNFILVLLIGFMATACANYTKHVVFDDTNTQAYQLEEVSSWGFFAPTYQIQRAKICEVKKTLIKSNDFGTGYESREAVNCRLIGAADGYHKDLGTPVGPSVMQAGATVGAGALIKEGLEDSGNTNNITNSNQQGQVQGQSQGQIQGQKQGVSVSGGCRGNCGGGPR